MPYYDNMYEYVIFLISIHFLHGSLRQTSYGNNYLYRIIHKILSIILVATLNIYYNLDKDIYVYIKNL